MKDFENLQDGFLRVLGESDEEESPLLVLLMFLLIVCMSVCPRHNDKSFGNI
jgi:hypothetical protein